MKRFATPFALTAIVTLGALAANVNADHFIKDSVDGLSSDFWTYETQIDRVVTIGIKGDGDTNLDLIIRDGNGDAIAWSARAYTDFEAVRFVALAGETYHIEVLNRGTVYNNYAMYIEE